MTFCECGKSREKASLYKNFFWLFRFLFLDLYFGILTIICLLKIERKTVEVRFILLLTKKEHPIVLTIGCSFFTGDHKKNNFDLK